MTIERPNTMAGLVEKRAEIAGEIAHTRAKLRQLIIDLDHVDAAIRLFDPNYDVEGIRQKIPSAAHRAIRGDMTRAMLGALRIPDLEVAAWRVESSAISAGSEVGDG